jgi:hypothetical protein
MKDIKKIQEFFSKPLEENTFKVGQKVTYLGHPAVVIATKEYNGKNYVSVSYDKGKGKTKASDILTTDGSIKPLKEMMSLDDQAIAENKLLKQAKLSSAEYQKVKKLKDFNPNDYEWDPSESLYVKEKKSKFKKHGEMSGFDMRGIDEASEASKFKKGDKITYYGNKGVVNSAKYNPFAKDWDYTISYIEDGTRKGESGVRDKELKSSPINEAKFTDYSNNELAAYAKELSKQRADAASKGQNDLVSGINKEIEAATRELKKRSQKLKDLSRTDVNEGGKWGYQEALKNMIKFLQTQLDDMGVEYEMSGNPYVPFKTIYKPINKSDDWYAKFEDLIDRANLGSVVKTSMNENFPGPGEVVDAKYLNNAMLDYFNRMNIKLLINTKTEKGIKGGVGTMYGDLVFNGDDIKLKDIVSVEIIESSISEAKKEEETTFHKKLDTLVHDTFGKRKGELEEAYVPSNIAEFAKRRGVSSLVRKVAGWAEKVGARITGGTAIGKGYNTLILDMGYQTADIRIDVEDETIELYDEPIYSFDDFKRVFMEEESRKQAEHDEETLRREQGLEEKSLNEKMLVPTDKIDRMARDIAAKYFSSKTDKKDAIEILKKAIKDSYRALDPEVEIREEEGYSQFLKDDPEHPGGKTKGLTPDVMNKILMRVVQDIEESRPGLWDNIRAKRERGEKPSRKGSKAYKSAVKAGKEINKAKD